MNPKTGGKYHMTDVSDCTIRTFVDTDDANG
jgi:hypothetical protein